MINTKSDKKHKRQRFMYFNNILPVLQVLPLSIVDKMVNVRLVSWGATSERVVKGFEDIWATKSTHSASAEVAYRVVAEGD